MKKTLIFFVCLLVALPLSGCLPGMGEGRSLVGYGLHAVISNDQPRPVMTFVEKGEFKKEEYIDEPVYRIETVLSDKTIFEIRLLNFVDAAARAKCRPGAGDECGKPIKYKKLFIVLKDSPQLDRVRLYKGEDLLVDEKIDHSKMQKY